MTVFHWQSAMCLFLSGWTGHVAVTDRPVMALVALLAFAGGILAMHSASHFAERP